MSNHETFQGDNSPLKPGEIFEFFGAVAEQLPRDLDPAKIRWFNERKSRIGAELRPVFAQPIPTAPALNVPLWQDFLGRMFRREFDLSGIHIPKMPDYPCRPLVNPLSIRNNELFDVCTKRFHGKTWKYVNDLDTIVNVVERPKVSYVVWVRDVVEADSDMAGKSAVDIERGRVNTETFFERALHELKFFDETGEHLDLGNWTLCAGSRNTDGTVPMCYWGDDEFSVGWAGVGGRSPGLRARVAVS